jgi:hypothetical protein
MMTATAMMVLMLTPMILMDADAESNAGTDADAGADADTANDNDTFSPFDTGSQRPVSAIDLVEKLL